MQLDDHQACSCQGQGGESYPAIEARSYGGPGKAAVRCIEDCAFEVKVVTARKDCSARFGREDYINYEHYCREPGSENTWDDFEDYCYNPDHPLRHDIGAIHGTDGDTDESDDTGVSAELDDGICHECGNWQRALACPHNCCGICCDGCENKFLFFCPLCTRTSGDVQEKRNTCLEKCTRERSSRPAAPATDSERPCSQLKQLCNKGAPKVATAEYMIACFTD